MKTGKQRHFDAGWRGWPGFRLTGLLAAFCLAMVSLPVRTAKAVEIDPRRDATVMAIEKVIPSVVNIGTKTRRVRSGVAFDWYRRAFTPYAQELPPQESAGSGVIIDEEGYVLTNAHVVDGANEIWVRVGDKIYQADLITGTRLTDIAVLRLKGKPGEKFPAAKFAPDDDLLTGETVIAAGNPFGLGVSVSRGILSSKSRRPYAETDSPLQVPDWLQTDAAINPGNSGGPLINLRGEVIGLNVAIYRDADNDVHVQGIGFAIPIKRVGEALSELFTPEELKGYWFGGQVKSGSSPLAVTNVQADSPAEKSGLKVGDLILRVDGKTPRNLIEFSRLLVDAGTNRDVPLFVRHPGDEQGRELEVRMVPEESYFTADLIRRRTGLSLQALTPELAEKLGFRFSGGYVVAAVEAGSPGAAAQIQQYYTIQGVDGQVPPNLVELAKYLHSRPKGERVRLDLVYSVPRGVFTEQRRDSVTLVLR